MQARWRAWRRVVCSETGSGGPLEAVLRNAVLSSEKGKPLQGVQEGGT